MATVRSSHIKAQVRDAYPYFMEKYEAQPATRNQIFESGSTSASYEQFTSAIGPGNITKVEEGVSIPRQTAQEGYTVYCGVYKYPTEQAITNEALADNQKLDNFLKSWAGGLGETISNKMEQDHADIFNYGGYTAGHETFRNSVAGVISPSYGDLIYDTKPFFALSGNNHAAKNGSTYYNSITSLNLNSSGLQQLMELIQITNAFNEAGQEVMIRPDTLLMRPGTNNFYTAKRLLESMGDMQESHSGVTNVWRGSLNLVGWRFLSDTNAIFVGCARKGLKALLREAPKIDYYEDQNVDSQIVRMRTRWGKCVTNWRYWVGANLSTS